MTKLSFFKKELVSLQYSVLQTLLQEVVAKTAFKKRGLIMFQLLATLMYTALHNIEQLINHLWTISLLKLKLTIFSSTEVKGMEREPLTFAWYVEGYWSFNKNTGIFTPHILKEVACHVFREKLKFLLPPTSLPILHNNFEVNQTIN